ncbi:MAG: hypothetical protein AAGJ56_09190 [Myxococcota bacterium]
MPTHDPLLLGMIGLLSINTLSGLVVQALLLRRASIKFPIEREETRFAIDARLQCAAVAQRTAIAAGEPIKTGGDKSE